MGLDVSHECWHGAYSAFSRWRQAVAEAAGYLVLPVKFDDDGATMPTIMLEWHRYQGGQLYGEREETPHDPLIVLFAHSDCEGVIHPAQAAPLADALEALLPKIAAAPEETVGHIARGGGYVEVTKRFIAGLREAVAAGEDVEFG